MTKNEKLQAELLSLILNNENLYYQSFDLIKAEMFSGANRQIFDAFTSLTAKSIKPDYTNISTESKVPLEKVIKVMTYYSGLPVDVTSLCYELFTDMAYDKLNAMTLNVSRQVTAGTRYEEISDIITKTLRDLELGTSSNVLTLKQGLENLTENIRINCKGTNSITGSRTGFTLVDDHMGGFHESDLVILAGETSHGKTAFALSMMYNSATRYGVRCGIISHEMSTTQIMARLAAFASGISAKHLLIGKLTAGEVQTYYDAVKKIEDSGIFIQDYIRRELGDTMSAIRLMKLQHDVKFVVVENAGNINVKGVGDNDERRTAEISKSLKALAMELKITIILISHLSREKEGRKAEPTLNRLRHSGQLEQDADVVIFVYNAFLHGYEKFPDESDIIAKGRCKVNIAKGRNYGLAVSYPEFMPELTYFKDYGETIYESAPYDADARISPSKAFENDLPF